MKNIVVVGAGASGLKLVKKLSSSTKFKVTLIDKEYRHVWKPLMHEIATGIRDEKIDSINLKHHSVANCYSFIHGEVINVNSDSKNVSLAKTTDESGQTIIPERTIDYDILVLAIGSGTNDFGNAEVDKHCQYVTSLASAVRAKEKLESEIERTHHSSRDATRITIVGGGPTGTELAANIITSVNRLNRHGFCSTDNSGLSIKIIEGGHTILPSMSPVISNHIRDALLKLNVEILNNTTVTDITEVDVTTNDGQRVPHDLIFWTAGIKCPDFVAHIKGVQVNRINQIKTSPFLTAIGSSSIFVLGDLANCVDSNGITVPATAQASHQMADHCYKNIKNLLEGREMKSFSYVDHGSIVKLNKDNSAGTLLTSIKRKDVTSNFIVKSITNTLYGAHIISVLGYRRGVTNLIYGKLSQFSGNNINFFNV